jgi:homoserine kinase type II
MAGIAEGVENSNFLLRTDQANFILTLYEKRVDKTDLPFFLGLMDHLSDSGLQCPVPIKDKSGQVLQNCAGRVAAIVSFLDGTSQKFPTVEKCVELGRTLARFHVDSSSFDLKRANTLGPDSWLPLLQSVDGKPENMPENLREEAEIVIDQLTTAWPSALPAGHIHADLFPNNALFVGDKLTGIIDFYFACNDLYSYDLAVCLNSWCFDKDGSFNITKSASLLKAYQNIRPLTDDEKEALPILSSGAAMRFFLTRLYDWMNTPADALVKPLDPLEFWARLRFHQKVASASDYGLWS